jgi:hypothetical protein
MAAVAAGQTISASLLNDKTRKVVARAARSTNSSATTSTTPIPVLRLDSIAVKAGRSYRITWKAAFDNNTATDTLRGHIRFTLTGSAAVAGSALLPGSAGEVHPTTASSPASGLVSCNYTPVSDARLSILLCVLHGTGTSSSLMQADGTSLITEMFIDDMGDDPGNTGVSL